MAESTTFAAKGRLLNAARPAREDLLRQFINGVRGIGPTQGKTGSTEAQHQLFWKNPAGFSLASGEVRAG